MLMVTRTSLPPSCMSDLRFDRWHAGELEATESRAIDAHVRTCARCRQRDQELRSQAEVFLRNHPLPSGLGSGPCVVPARGGKRVSRWRVASMSGVLAFASVVGWLVLAPKRNGASSRQAAETVSRAHGRDEVTSGVRAKGGPRLGFFVKRDGRVLRGHNGFTVHPGDLLRFSVTTLEPRHLAILSRDGRGVVSECYPGDGRSRGLAVSRDDLLDSSVELDDTLGDEKIVAVFCDEPFEVGPLAARLGRAGALVVGEGCSLDSLDIRKTAR
jgi:hypothetical protein